MREKQRYVRARTAEWLQVSMELVELLDDPELCLDAIRGYTSIENASARILLGQYENYDDSLKRA